MHLEKARDMINITLFKATLICGLTLLCFSFGTISVAKNLSYKAVRIGMNDADGANRQKKWFNEFDANNSLSLLTHSYKGTLYSTSNCDSTTGLKCLKSTSFFFIHTHGDRLSVKFTDSKKKVTHLTTAHLRSADLSNLQLVVYGTCYSGQGSYDGDNIVNSTYKAGAKHVVGFQGKTYVNQTNTFLAQFIHELGTDKESFGNAYDNALFWVKLKHYGNAGGIDKVLMRGNRNSILRK